MSIRPITDVVGFCDAAAIFYHQAQVLTVSVTWFAEPKMGAIAVLLIPGEPTFFQSVAGGVLDLYAVGVHSFGEQDDQIPIVWSLGLRGWFP